MRAMLQNDEASYIRNSVRKSIRSFLPAVLITVVGHFVACLEVNVFGYIRRCYSFPMLGNCL